MYSPNKKRSVDKRLSFPEWKKIGTVDEINLYPIYGGKSMSVKSALCTEEGLQDRGISDWNFIIYEQDSLKVCTTKNYPHLAEIDIDFAVVNSSAVISNGDVSKLIHFSFSCRNEQFYLQQVLLHENEVFFVRDCGEDAANYLTKDVLKSNTKLRMGLYRHYAIDKYKEQYKKDIKAKPESESKAFSVHLESKNRFVLLNTASLDTLTKEVPALGNIGKRGFFPNIIIKTEIPKPFSEFNWKKIQIGSLLFERIAACRQCTTEKVDTCFKDSDSEKENFYEKLKQNLEENVDLENSPTKKSSRRSMMEDRKYPSFRKPDSMNAPNLTVDVKYLDDQFSTINCGDNVYAYM